MESQTVVTVASLTRLVVNDLEPSESEPLEIYLAAYEQDPGIVRRVADGGDDATGFGEALAVFTPYVVAVVACVLNVLSSQVVEAAKAESGERIRRLVRRLAGRAFDRRRRPAVPAADVASLTKAQLDTVREVAYRKAKELRLPTNRARVLADAIVGALVVSTQ